MEPRKAFDEAKIEEFRKRVIEWYEVHGDKDLPWRKTRDGWAVLVAAVLLRKTTTEQVLRVYKELLQRYPSPHSLLSASESEVKELIKPLGIEHQRAKQLIEIARILVQHFGGRVPCSKKELVELPGVGDYIASEVLLRACNQPEPLLDRNVIRAIERIFGVKSARKRPHTDPAIWAFAKKLMPENPELAEKFSFGLLDLARKLCTSRKPQCVMCPLRDMCAWFKSTAGSSTA